MAILWKSLEVQQYSGNAKSNYNGVEKQSIQYKRKVNRISQIGLDLISQRLLLSPNPAFPEPVDPMDTQQSHRQLPEVKFRVLVLGKANAGKTTLLQRVCGTTNSPIIYRSSGLGGQREEVCRPIFL